jgi:hypothetical protein
MGQKCDHGSAAWHCSMNSPRVCNLVGMGEGICTIRSSAGLHIPGTFSLCRYWVGSMFNVRIVGTANAISAGWGNMGGGVTALIMPLLYEVSWLGALYLTWLRRDSTHYCSCSSIYHMPASVGRTQQTDAIALSFPEEDNTYWPDNGGASGQEPMTSAP